MKKFNVVLTLIMVIFAGCAFTDADGSLKAMAEENKAATYVADAQIQVNQAMTQEYKFEPIMRWK